MQGRGGEKGRGLNSPATHAFLLHPCFYGFRAFVWADEANKKFSVARTVLQSRGLRGATRSGHPRQGQGSFVPAQAAELPAAPGSLRRTSALRWLLKLTRQNH